MKRWFALVTFLSLLLIAFAGCAGGDDNGFADSDSGSGGDSSSDGGGFGKDSGGKDATTADDGGVSDSGTDSGFDAGFDAGPPVDAGPPFNVSSAASLNDVTVTVTFDAPPNPTEATTLTNYAFTNGLTVSAATLSGDVVTLTTSVQTAISYTVTVTGVTRDPDARALATNQATFTGVGAFDVSSAVSTSSTTVNVTFDAAPDPTSAAIASNYAITGSGGLTVSAAVLSGNVVTLTTSTQTAGTYTVTVSGVTRAGDAATLAIDHVNFTGHPTFNVSSATATSATTVTVTFDAAPNSTNGALAASYSISGGITVSAASVSGNVATLTTSVQSATALTVTVTGVTRASDGEPLTTNTANFTGKTPFNLLSATSTSSATVDLLFDAPPDPTSATTAGNYVLSGGLTVTGATLTGSTVTLSTSVQSASVFSVTVSNVTRASDGAGLTTKGATFTGTAPSAPTVTSVDVASTTSDSSKIPYNTGTSTVTITGTEFLAVPDCLTGVKLDDTNGAVPAVAVNTAPASCTIDTNTQITATFPAGIRTNGAAGWNVLVTNSVGTNTPTVKFVPRAGLLISGVMLGSTVSGGTAGDHEFIEIYNPTGNSIDTSSAGVNLKLHTFSQGGGDSGNKPLTLVTGKSMTIISHGFLLLAPKNLTGDTWDGTIDATYSTSSLSANGGLYISILSSANGANVIDKFGWGTQVSGFEGTVYGSNLINDNVAVRLPGAGAGHATDSDNNAADFNPTLSTTIAPKGTASGKEDP